ncbi:MAG: NAD(P)H-hydrate dehydratase [Lachnospiraceae bacterium]|nr:NAD(P)H-hydrate dehydratase [Lachnospiraceae bacterium]
MKYSLNAAQAKEIDRYTIEEIGIPSVVLMEKAALGVAYAVREIASHSDDIIAVCGTGNNGGDAVATARILAMAGYSVKIRVVGDLKNATKEMKQQLKIAKNAGVKVIKKVNYRDFKVVIDGIFGIGLSRQVTGDIYKEIEQINAARLRTVSVDVPSGVGADDGRIFGIAVRADVTVTFGSIKTGCLLYPGAEYAGRVVIWDIGTNTSVLETPPTTFYYDEEPQLLLPARKVNSNKGSYGRVLIAAGSKNMAGAAYLAAAAAYRTGAGLVRVLTTSDNREIIQKKLPEAVLTTYEVNEKGMLKEESIEDIKEAIEWATVVLIGPGIGKNGAAAGILNYCITECKAPLIVDADGINILAKLVTEKAGQDATTEERIQKLAEILPPGTILTPHKKELSRLIGVSLAELSLCLWSAAEKCTVGNDLIFVKKDVRSLVSFGNSNYINVSGNDGMATGGSGDVLGGIIAGLIAQGESRKAAAMTGCYIHGLAGNAAAAKTGARSMLAGDILEAIPEIISPNTKQKEN